MSEKRERGLRGRSGRRHTSIAAQPTACAARPRLPARHSACASVPPATPCAASVPAPSRRLRSCLPLSLCAALAPAPAPTLPSLLCLPLSLCAAPTPAPAPAPSHRLRGRAAGHAGGAHSPVSAQELHLRRRGGHVPRVCGAGENGDIHSRIRGATGECITLWCSRWT